MTVISLLVLLDSGVVVIIWYLDLQLTIQSVPITTNVVISAQVRSSHIRVLFYKRNINFYKTIQSIISLVFKKVFQHFFISLMVKYVQ
jgi:hypothetical protein